jgi:hypothetical protein
MDDVRTKTYADDAYGWYPCIEDTREDSCIVHYGDRSDIQITCCSMEDATTRDGGSWSPSSYCSNLYYVTPTRRKLTVNLI